MRPDFATIHKQARNVQSKKQYNNSESNLTWQETRNEISKV